VQTLHNYRLACPGATLFREGGVCEKCIGRAIAVPALRHRCYRGSLAATATVVAMLGVHRTIGTYNRAVDRYVACSHFTKGKLVQHGLHAEKISVKPNFIVNDPGAGRERGDYAMFLGRLSREKGLDTLLDAWQRVPPTMHLKLVGNGPLSDRVQEVAARHAHIEWLPGKSDDEVQRLMRAAKFLVLPSVNYEGFPKTIVESFSVATPVVASNIGAMAELVDDRRTGRLFSCGDSAHLESVVRELYFDEVSLRAMQHEARREFETKYTAEINYDLLLEIYNRAIDCRRSLRTSRRQQAESPTEAENTLRVIHS
jgi:glycosyltransferase involved in cell wall biosynthesis